MFILFYFTEPRDLWDLSSLTRDRTQVLAVKQASPNHWTAKEVSHLAYFEWECFLTPTSSVPAPMRATTFTFYLGIKLFAAIPLTVQPDQTLKKLDSI